VHTDPSKLANPAALLPLAEASQMPVLTGRKQADWSAEKRMHARPRVKASKNPKSAVFRSRKKAGTVLAIKGMDTGSVMPEASGIVRRGRRSTELRLREIENILAAADNTGREQRGLNRFTTIHFEAAKVRDPVRAIGRLMKLAGDWLRTKGTLLAYVWVRESGERKGEHVHILWYIRPDLIKDFARLERGWRKRLGAKPARGAFKSKPVGLSYRHGAHQIQYGQDYRRALAGVLSYIVKGAEPKAVEELGLSVSKPGGELWGKRSGTSENIGRTARNRA
jgi:hypothetical protein